MSFYLISFEAFAASSWSGSHLAESIGMPRLLRFIPPGGALAEVTTRTFQGRFLLTPGPALNRIIVGALARASRRHEVKVVAAAFVSNHFHLAVWVEDSDQLAGFMTLFNSKLAREVARLTGWTDKVWSRRYQAIVVSQEEGAQVDRLRYILAHGCKEGLVARLSEWPGVHAAPAILAGAPLEGIWHDRTREYLARIQGKEFCPEEYAEAEVLSFSPLPCWAHLSAEQYRARVGRLVEEIEAEAAAQAVRSGREPLGVEAVRRQERTARPNRIKKAPAPRFHAFTKKVRLELYQAYSWFASAFREAAEKWKAGDRGALFPAGCFPPGLPFVREGLVQAA